MMLKYYSSQMCFESMNYNYYSVHLHWKPIIQVVDALTAGEANIAARYAGAELVAALEDHIPGFS